MPHKKTEDIFIIEPLRTPFGSFGGSLSDVPAPVLASHVIKEIVTRTQVPAKSIDEVIIGQVLQGGSGQAPARQALRLAGLPDHIPAMTINKVCGSGLKAMMLASDSIRAGESEIVIAGGMENMSLAPYFLPKSRFGKRMGHRQILDMMIYDGLQDAYSGTHMGEITEAWIDKHQLTRREQDEYAIRSFQLAQAAMKNGLLQEELVYVEKKIRKGSVVVSEDEEPMRVDFNKLMSLPSAFRQNGTITAANASTISDGAALALVAGQEAVEKYNLQPVAKLVTSATVGMAPDLFPETDVHGIEKLVQKAGLDMGDIGLFEINEAFAAVVLLTIQMLKLDISKVNVNGGAVALGHPIGASGGRLVAALTREMKRRNERYGIVTLFLGGGEAVASLFELVDG